MGRVKDKYGMKGFAALPLTLLNSSAYKELHFSSAKALPYFFVKTRSWLSNPEFYQIEFPFSYREASRYGFAPATFFKTIKDLVSIGFVDPVRRGGKRGDGYSSSVFKMSRRWEKYGTCDFININWSTILPEKSLKPMPKKKTHNARKGKELDTEALTISQNDVVATQSSP